MSITRTELASHIDAAFTHGPADRNALIAYAMGSHARPEVIALLTSLPDTSFDTLRNLWYHLADMPVGT